MGCNKFESADDPEFVSLETKKLNRVARGWKHAMEDRCLSDWARAEGVTLSALIKAHKNYNPDLWRQFEINDYRMHKVLRVEETGFRDKLLIGIELGAWTQAAAAEALGVTTSGVSRYRKKRWGDDTVYREVFDTAEDEVEVATFIQQCLLKPLGEHSVFETLNRVAYYAKESRRFELLENASFAQRETFKGDDCFRVRLPGVGMFIMLDPYNDFYGMPAR